MHNAIRIALIVAWAGSSAQAVELVPGDIVIASGWGVLQLDRTGELLEAWWIFDGAPSPLDVAIDAQHNIVGVATELFRLDPATGQVITVSSGPFAAPTSVAISANGTLYVVDSGAIIRIDPTTGSHSSVGPGDGFLAVAPNGDLLMAEYSTVYRVDPETGQRTVLAQGFGGAADITLEPSGDLFVLDSWNFEVVRVDLLTGDWIATYDISAICPDHRCNPVAVAAEPEASVLVTPPVSTWRMEASRDQSTLTIWAGTSPSRSRVARTAWTMTATEPSIWQTRAARTPRTCRSATRSYPATTASTTTATEGSTSIR
jgi:hypothetical protein